MKHCKFLFLFIHTFFSLKNSDFFVFFTIYWIKFAERRVENNARAECEVGHGALWLALLPPLPKLAEGSQTEIFFLFCIRMNLLSKVTENLVEKRKKKITHRRISITKQYSFFCFSVYWFFFFVFKLEPNFFHGKFLYFSTKVTFVCSTRFFC